MKKIVYILLLFLCGSSAVPLLAAPVFEPAPDTSLQMTTASWETKAEAALWNKAVVNRVFSSDKLPVHPLAMDGYATIRKLRDKLIAGIQKEKGEGASLIVSPQARLAKHLVHEIIQVDFMPLSDSEEHLLSQVDDWSVSLSFLSDGHMQPGTLPEHTFMAAITAGATTNTNQRDIKPGGGKKVTLRALQQRNVSSVLKNHERVAVDYFSLFLYIWEDNPDKPFFQTAHLPSFHFLRNASMFSAVTAIQFHKPHHHTTQNLEIMQGDLL